MARLTLFIGPAEASAARLRGILKEKAAPLLKRGVLAPEWNHVRLFAACADPDTVDVLRFKRGLDDPLMAETLATEFRALIPKDLEESGADHVVLAAAQLGSLYTDPAEVARLHDLLTPFFEDIRIVAMVEEQARMLVPQYTYAVNEGRDTGLEAELALAPTGSWWQAALAQRGETDAHLGIFNDVRHPAPWLDFTALLALWEGAFGAGKVTLMPLDTKGLGSDRGTAVVEAMLGLDKPLGTVAAEAPERAEPAVNLARMRAFNAALIRLCRARDVACPRELWQNMLTSLRIPGAPVAAGSLAAISDRFRADNAALLGRFPDLAAALTPDAPLPPYTEPDPQYGFRATQYLAAFDFHLRRQAIPIAEKRAEAAAAAQAAEKFDDMLATPDEGAEAVQERLLNRIKINHRMVLSTRFRPHNDLGTVQETEAGAPYAPAPPRRIPSGSTGRVIVGCMKNEAPYILEWIAYHRAIGVDNFLIYTNGCTDGTDEILDRLMEMGVVQHRNNDDWKGNSPQQHALNRSLKEPVIRDAEWIIHIDVDEFMNVRTGNGTLDDLFAAVPDATNFAMTWRLFGHNGVTELNDCFVIDQFDACAPSFCPKPHTVWGFKTMFRNIGAYAKISCHRPNKLAEGFEERVKWVNGSGRDMTRDALHNGWRSSRGNIGYDLLQLNHYALRSAESYLIKRQRGRALHVDRSIGLNYWIRMDWSDHRDLTIKRNLPRLRAEYDRLLSDDRLRAHHEAGLAWHRAKAAELRAEPEFADLYRQALEVKLDETERVAYALSLDMES